MRWSAGSLAAFAFALAATLLTGCSRESIVVATPTLDAVSSVRPATPAPTLTPSKGATRIAPLATAPATPATVETALAATNLVLTVTSPVAVGAVAGATLSGATPGDQCRIFYTTPTGTQSTASGLAPAAADPNGMARWSWRIGTATRPGAGLVVVRCGAAEARAEIVVR